MIRSLLRFIFTFIVASFFFVRQIYVNLLHLDRATVSALFVLSMSAVAFWLFWGRIKKRAPAFYIVDGILALQFTISGIAIACYWLAGKINPAETAYSVFYYCFAPLLLYVGFYLGRKEEKEVRGWVVVASLVFAVMLIASVLQVLGIDWWLFSNERWAFQPTFFGVSRATGAYGTQIDFGLLSFIFFVYSFYKFLETKSTWHVVIATLGFFGTVLTFSRVFIFACAAVLICHFLRRGALASLRKGATLLSTVLIAVITVAVFQQLNIIAIFQAEDALTQESNEGRLFYMKSAPKWFFEEYPYVGTGPGTQNGPNDETKIVSDSLWLAFLVEFGFLVGLIVVLLKVALVSVVVLNYLRSKYRPALWTAAFVLSVCFLLASLVDSAYAHMVSISIFYSIVGVFLYQRCVQHWDLIPQTARTV